MGVLRGCGVSEAVWNAKCGSTGPTTGPMEEDGSQPYVEAVATFTLGVYCLFRPLSCEEDLYLPEDCAFGHQDDAQSSCAAANLTNTTWCFVPACCFVRLLRVLGDLC